MHWNISWRNDEENTERLPYEILINPIGHLIHIFIPFGQTIKSGTGRLNIFNNPSDRPSCLFDRPSMILHKGARKLFKVFFKFCPHIEEKAGPISQRHI